MQDTQGYITDVSYTDAYYDNLNPVLLNYIAGINGMNPPDNLQQFDYCELGCGNGLTLNLLADANPDSRFVGVDLNYEHIRHARETAEAGGLQNITYIDQSFANLLQEDLPDFDYISLHGVYSWISPELRASIVEFIKCKLKPGGIVMVSYNAMPGRAIYKPLRDMMLTYTANMQADPLEKAQFGLSYLDFMNQKGAKFFTQNPSAVKILERLKKLDMRYIAHEFFNQHWNPLYFTEVAEEMRGASLSFAGNAEVSRNYGELTIPAGFLEDFKEITDRYSFEAHRSFVNNESFRSDIYCKPMKVSGDTNFMRNFAFIGLVTLENYNSTLKTEAATLELNGKLFQPLIQVLYARVMTLDQLCKQPALNAFGEQEISDGLQKLVMTGQVIPLKPVQETSASEQPYGREMSSLLNGHLLGQYRLTNPVLALSSPVMGRAWKFSLGDALMLFGLTRKDQRQAIAAIRGKLRMEEKILNTKDGKQIAKQEEEKFIQQELQVFIDNQLPLLQRLGFFKGEE